MLKIGTQAFIGWLLYGALVLGIVCLGILLARPSGAGQGSFAAPACQPAEQDGFLVCEDFIDHETDFALTGYPDGQTMYGATFRVRAPRFRAASNCLLPLLPPPKAQRL
jgi:hypothetical protein